MRLAIRFTLPLAAALISTLAGCGESPAAPPMHRQGRPITPPSATTDSTQCLSGYSVANGVVTCNDPR